jgi:hypothetical protein
MKIMNFMKVQRDRRVLACEEEKGPTINTQTNWYKRKEKKEVFPWRLRRCLFACVLYCGFPRPFP